MLGVIKRLLAHASLPLPQRGICVSDTTGWLTTQPTPRHPPPFPKAGRLVPEEKKRLLSAYLPKPQPSAPWRAPGESMWGGAVGGAQYQLSLPPLPLHSRRSQDWGHGSPAAPGLWIWGSPSRDVITW